MKSSKTKRNCIGAYMIVTENILLMKHYYYVNKILLSRFSVGTGL